MPTVTVLGAGVIGLTTAQALEEANFDVQVIAEATGPAITSFAAGAIWFPFKAEPPHLVNRWAAQTRRWLTELAGADPQSGVDMVRLYELADTDARPWWADAVEDELEQALPHQPPGRPQPSIAWTFLAPRVEPALFMPTVLGRLRRPVDLRRVVSFEDCPGDIVVNCTGLGSRRLAGDPHLHAMFGQTVIVAPDGLDLFTSLSDERDPQDFFYAIPRRAEVVLGGIAEPHDADQPAVPRPQVREAILARAARFGVKPVRVLRDSAGLRPCRPAVRLERDGRVIHNYGHGGSGYTLCRGCAQDVVKLVQSVL